MTMIPHSYNPVAEFGAPSGSDLLRGCRAREPGAENSRRRAEGRQPDVQLARQQADRRARRHEERRHEEHRRGIEQESAARVLADLAEVGEYAYGDNGYEADGDGEGDVNIGGAESDVEMGGVDDATEYNGDDNRHHDGNGEATATAPVGRSHTRKPNPNLPHSPRFWDTPPPQTPPPARPPTLLAPANRRQIRGYSGSVQLPPHEDVRRERERRFGGSAEMAHPCGCLCRRPWGEDGYTWHYCDLHQWIRQQEEDENVEEGTTVPRDWDEKEPPRGRSRFREE